jgi:hypothetical protein
VEEDNNNEKPQGEKRKFLGVWFECCHAYGRLYKNKAGTKYIGRCPKCLRSLSVEINANSEKATNRRFFRGR